MLRYLIFVALLVYTTLGFNFSDGVYDVTDYNFKELFDYTKKKRGAMLMYFYSEYDDPMKTYLDEFQKAGQELHKDGDKLYLGKVNADTEYALRARYNIKTTPKVVYMSYQEAMKYRYLDDVTSASQIIRDARRIIPPGPKFFSNQTKFDHIFSEGHHLFVGFFEDLDSNEVVKFEAFSRFMRYQNFAYTNNISIATDFGLTQPKNGIALFYKRELLSQDEPRFVEYLDRSETLNNWGLTNYLLPVDKYDKFTDLFYTNKYKFKTMLMFEDLSTTMYSPYSNLTLYRDYLTQSLPNVGNMTELCLLSETDFKFLYSMLDPHHYVELVAFKNGKWYKSLTNVMTSDNEFRPEVLEQFVQDVYYNHITPFVRSQPLPEEEYKDGIMQVVGSNIDTKLDQPGQEYLIMFYVDWNPRCDQFREIMKQLAKNELSEVPDFQLVEMEASENWIPNRFKNFEMPTIYFVRDDYKPMRYIEHHSKRKVLEFLENYSVLYQKKLADGDL